MTMMQYLKAGKTQLEQAEPDRSISQGVQTILDVEQHDYRAAPGPMLPSGTIAAAVARVPAATIRDIEIRKFASLRKRNGKC